MSANNGGPAFPTAADNGHSTNQDGMTLRDYFAAKVMQAHLGLLDQILSDPKSKGVDIDLAICKSAYRIADAMLKAREWGDK